MFGKNPLRKARQGDGKSLLVHSIFYTIQGEGPFSGVPAVFIRLAGCNLACTFCDTEFENDAMSLLVEDVMETVTKANGGRCSLIVLTGGEPLRQEVGPLILELLFEGYRVQIETAGTLWPDTLDLFESDSYWRSEMLSIVCSPKTGKVHPKVVERCRDWKYIIQVGGVAEVDGLPMFSTQRAGAPMTLFRPTRKPDQIWLQPMDEYTFSDGKHQPNHFATQQNMRLAAHIAMQFNYRITLQTHKILELP